MWLDLQPTSKSNAVCWVELRCVDKAFSTDMLSRQIRVCVGVCVSANAHQGLANKGSLMSHQGGPLPLRRTI